MIYLVKKPNSLIIFSIIPALNLVSGFFLHVYNSDTDDLTQYLDQLLAKSVPQRSLRVGEGPIGLGRFKAAANQTREMVSLVNKAKELQLQSEHCSGYSVIANSLASQFFASCTYFFQMYKCICLLSSFDALNHLSI